MPAAPVPYVADLHIHSRYSRACSRDLDLPNLAWWARRKGITLLGTGDFTHPAWYDHLREHLVPAEPGLFRLDAPGRPLPPSVAGHEVRFMLSVEISTIYKRDDRTRKVHHLIYLPDLDAVARFNGKLGRIGRRGALAFYFALMTISISSGFGYAFYLPHRALEAFLPCLFLVGVGGGNFSVYWVWLPEQYDTHCRGSAIAFATCVGRFVAAGATFIVGIGISHFGSIGVPVALTSIAFALGLLVIPFTLETKGQSLPD